MERGLEQGRFPIALPRILLGMVLAGSMSCAPSGISRDCRVLDGAPPSAWMKDLVIYEIATKGFTSPRGPESGTFEGLRERLPYLQELGITGIWLSGHSLSDPRHFYNCWTQYACVHPGEIDRTLGTRRQLRALIQEAHRRGIRVFLDVITHGVMSGSPLVKEHPGWFQGGSWGMTDYHWAARIPELDNWWVDLWTRCVTEDGVDGFRLDVDIYRWDLWKRIRENAAAAGHPIVVFTEWRQNPEPGLSDVVDFVQLDHPLGRWGEPHRPRLTKNVAEFHKTGSPESRWKTVQLSCHDEGWEGSLEKNPYVAKGSRFLFGYSLLFSGMIPIFMAGEEFDARFRPVPCLSPGLFGGKNPGEGTWLYGGMLPWDDLKDPEHEAMLKDVKRMLSMRRTAPGLLDAFAAEVNGTRIALLEVPHQASRPAAVPYVRWAKNKAVVVLGNPDTQESVWFTLRIPLSQMGMAGFRRYKVTDLWNGESRMASEEDLGRLRCQVKPDRTAGGGVGVLEIEGIDPP